MSDIRLKIKEEVLKFRKEILSEEMVQSEAYKALKNTLKTLKKKNKVLLLTCSNRFNWDEENIDIAEEGLHSLMRSKNEQIRYKSIEFYLKTKGKKRGYVEKHEIKSDVNVKGLTVLTVNPDDKEQLMKLRTYFKFNL